MLCSDVTRNGPSIAERGCSYVWRAGRLDAVPASRADVFRDRRLSPPAKRALMRFLQRAAAAMRAHSKLQVFLSWGYKECGKQALPALCHAASCDKALTGSTCLTTSAVCLLNSLLTFSTCNVHSKGGTLSQVGSCVFCFHAHGD